MGSVDCELLMAFPGSDQHPEINTINLDELTELTDTETVGSTQPPAKRFKPTLEQQLLAARCTSTNHQRAVQSLHSAIGQAEQASRFRPAILRPSAPPTGRITSITSRTVAHHSQPPVPPPVPHNMANPKRKTREGKDSKDDSSPSEVGEGNPPSPATQEDAVDPVAAQVIENFLSHWEKFKDGMAKDLKSLVTTVCDPKTGLVKHVRELEREVDSLKKTHSPGATTAGQVTTQQFQELSQQYVALQAQLNQIAEVNPDGSITLRAAELLAMRDTIDTHSRQITIILGYIHIMEREITNLDHKTTINVAKLIQNTIIAGGVCTSMTIPPREAFLAFLHNLLHIKPRPGDLMEVDALGGRFTKMINDVEVTFPPPLRARCVEPLAAAIM